METEARLAVIRDATSALDRLVAEIERLRGGLRAISDYCGSDYYLGDAGEMARRVLDGKDARAWLG